MSHIRLPSESAGIRFPLLLSAYDVLVGASFNEYMTANLPQLRLINGFSGDFKANMDNWEKAFSTADDVEKPHSIGGVRIGPFGNYLERNRPATQVILRHIADDKIEIHPTIETLSLLATQFGILNGETSTFNHLRNKYLHTTTELMTDWANKTVFKLPTRLLGISAEISVAKPDMADDSINDFKLVIDREKMGLKK